MYVSLCISVLVLNYLSTIGMVAILFNGDCSGNILNEHFLVICTSVINYTQITINLIGKRLKTEHLSII